MVTLWGLSLANISLFRFLLNHATSSLQWKLITKERERSPQTLKHGHSHHHILQKSGFSIQGSSPYCWHFVCRASAWWSPRPRGLRISEVGAFRSRCGTDASSAALQQTFPMTFFNLFNTGSFQDSYGLKETGTKWWLLKLLNTFEKITLDRHSHLENLAFHPCHLSSVKDGDMQNNGDTIIPQPHHATENKSTRTRQSNLLLTEMLRHDGDKGQNKKNKKGPGPTSF